MLKLSVSLNINTILNLKYSRRGTMEMKKHLARFLAMVMIMISIPMNVFADEIDKIISVNTNARQEKVINEDNVIQKTENKTVYELENGLKREVLYDTNVRFYDKNNKLYPLGAI